MKKDVMINMKLLLVILIILLVGNTSVGSGGESALISDDDHLENMDELALWFIETGLGQYYERKGKNNY